MMTTSSWRYELSVWQCCESWTAYRLRECVAYFWLGYWWKCCVYVWLSISRRQQLLRKMKLLCRAKKMHILIFCQSLREWWIHTLGWWIGKDRENCSTCSLPKQGKLRRCVGKHVLSRLADSIDFSFLLIFPLDNDDSSQNGARYHTCSS